MEAGKYEEDDLLVAYSAILYEEDETLDPKGTDAAAPSETEIE